jgi:hypothetical protein
MSGDKGPPRGALVPRRRHRMTIDGVAEMAAPMALASAEARQEQIFQQRRAAEAAEGQ